MSITDKIKQNSGILLRKINLKRIFAPSTTGAVCTIPLFFIFHIPYSLFFMFLKILLFLFMLDRPNRLLCNSCTACWVFSGTCTSNQKLNDRWRCSPPRDPKFCFITRVQIYLQSLFRIRKISYAVCNLSFKVNLFSLCYWIHEVIGKGLSKRPVRPSFLGIRKGLINWEGGLLGTQKILAINIFKMIRLSSCYQASTIGLLTNKRKIINPSYFPSFNLSSFKCTNRRLDLDWANGLAKCN